MTKSIELISTNIQDMVLALIKSGVLICNGVGRNVTIFEGDMGSSTHIYNMKKDMLILR